MDRASLAATIDQTLLRPTVGFAEASAWMEANREQGFATLCVSPFLVPLATQHLAGTSTNVCSVVGFPLGFALTETKAEEALHLVELGCLEVDMVLNVAALLEGEHTFVRDDIRAVTEAVDARSSGRALVKVILETGHLQESDIARGCELAVEGGAAFVKTSTGFGPRGAVVRDVEIMCAAVGGCARVKASGGIRDLDTALALLSAGADRIGTSAGQAILAEADGRDH